LLLSDAFILYVAHPHFTSPTLSIPFSIHHFLTQTLGVLLDKGAAALKAFAPQLQTTFVKALSDPSKQTRVKAIHALGKLMGISTRVDPLLTELTTQCAGAESNAIRCSIIDALSTVVEKGGHLATAPILEKVKTAVFQYVVEEEEVLRASSSNCIGKLSFFFDGVAVGDLVLDLAEEKAAEHATFAVAGRCAALGGALQHAGKRLDATRSDVFKFLSLAFDADKSALGFAASAALLNAFTLPTISGAEERTEEFCACIGIALNEFVLPLSKQCSKDKFEDTRRIAMSAFKEAAKNAPDACRKHAKIILPVVIEAWRDINLRVKGIADRLFYNLSDGGAAPHLSAFAQLLNGDDAAYMRAYSSKSIVKMPAVETEEEW